MASTEFKLTPEEQQKKAELEQKHKATCYLIRGAGVDSWAKEPSIQDIDAFMIDNSDPKLRGRALITLFANNIAEGDRASVFGKRPGAIVAHAGAYGDAVGLTADAILGK